MPRNPPHLVGFKPPPGSALSLAADDAAAPTWRNIAHTRHDAWLGQMQHEMRGNKGITDYVAIRGEGPNDPQYWISHAQFACYFDEPLTASRSYREALRLDGRLGSGFHEGALMALGKVGP